MSKNKNIAKGKRFMAEIILGQCLVFSFLFTKHIHQLSHPQQVSKAKEVHELRSSNWELELLEGKLSFLPTVHWPLLVSWCHGAQNSQGSVSTPSMCLKMGQLKAFGEKNTNCEQMPLRMVMNLGRVGGNFPSFSRKFEE